MSELYQLTEASRNELLALAKSDTITRYRKSAQYKGFNIVDIDTTSIFRTDTITVTCKVGDYYDTVEMNDILIWIQMEAERNPNNQVNTKKILDICAPAVILSQAIGRWGNFFNQEAYGMAVSSDLLHKLLVPNFIIDGMNINGTTYLPTFYFECIWCIIGFIIILFIRKKDIKIGTITAFYLIWYGIGRGIIETFRTDSLMFFGLK